MACSAPCPARARFDVRLPAPRPRRKPAPNCSARRWHWFRTGFPTGTANWRTSPPDPRKHHRQMDLGVPLSEIFWPALAVVVGGVITGVLAGLFGIGGGAVSVPALYEVFRILDVPEAVRMQLCVGTSLAIIVPTTLRSFRAHREKGLV